MKGWFCRLLVAVTFLCGMTWTALAFADACDDLDGNRAWNRNFEKLTEAYLKKDYDAALEYSKALEAICEQSPTLNYTIARIHQSRGDAEKYLFYLQKATQNTERFAVDKDLLDKLWSEKYVAAHPEASPEAIAERNAKIQAQDDEIRALRVEMAAQRNAIDDAMLWSGVGVGAAGLALTAVGAALVGMHHDSAVDAGTKGLYVKSEYTTGWALLGTGIGLTLVGAAVAGVFGYKYSQNHGSDGIGDVSFTVTPVSTSLSFSF